MIRRLWIKWLNRHDPACKMQTPPVMRDGYDQSKAVAGYHRSQAHTASGRAIPKPCKPKQKEPLKWHVTGERK